MNRNLPATIMTGAKSLIIIDVIFQLFSKPTRKHIRNNPSYIYKIRIAKIHSHSKYMFQSFNFSMDP